jgi:hypothetical protein
VRRAAALPALALALLVLQPAGAAAAPAEWRCDYGRSSDAVPADFPLESCVAGGWVTLHNDTTSPVVVSGRGDVGDAVVMRTDGDAAGGALLSLIADGADVLQPGDVARWPLGDGVAELVVTGLQPAQAAPIAETLADVLDGAGRADLQPYASLVGRLVDTVADRGDCSPERNFLGRAACDVDTAVRIGRAVSEELEADAALDVAPYVLDPVRWTEWSTESRSALRSVIRFDARGVLLPAPAPAPVPVLPVESPDRRTATGSRDTSGSDAAKAAGGPSAGPVPASPVAPGPSAPVPGAAPPVAAPPPPAPAPPPAPVPPSAPGGTGSDRPGGGGSDRGQNWEELARALAEWARSLSDRNRDAGDRETRDGGRDVGRDGGGNDRKNDGKGRHGG